MGLLVQSLKFEINIKVGNLDFGIFAAGSFFIPKSKVQTLITNIIN